MTVTTSGSRGRWGPRSVLGGQPAALAWLAAAVAARLASNRLPSPAGLATWGGTRPPPRPAPPHPLPRRLGLRRQALELEQIPVAQQRPQDLIVVDPQVIDAGPSHLQGLAGKALDAHPGHVEAEHLLGDGLD